jgi:hypothetical protein
MVISIQERITVLDLLTDRKDCLAVGKDRQHFLKQVFQLENLELIESKKQNNQKGATNHGKERSTGTGNTGSI